MNIDTYPQIKGAMSQLVSYYNRRSKNLNSAVSWFIFRSEQ